MNIIKHTTLVAAVLTVISCSKKEEKKEELLRPVRYHVISTSDAQKIRTYSGVAKAGNEIELSFRSNGVITKINANAGRQVRKGDLIAQLDNVQAKLSYEQSVSAFDDE